LLNENKTDEQLQGSIIALFEDGKASRIVNKHSDIKKIAEAIQENISDTSICPLIIDTLERNL
jgi:hypothetical protein